ncbi:glycerol-3-phosphate dehydrogenase/oxidase [Altericista sp. CCNU0014]|uniref:glycerol-3-phosphate dehydrogenase/oxidase n=1 Tax=Altericista sp. CCNU0014 TaxID=3082949 RepID=UPI00384DD832
MDRTQALLTLKTHPTPFDIAIVGGGATGLGTAVDAASRGHTVALIEQSDFAKGTSSRSTKLVHGGVRYLRQGNLSLVFGALRERGLLYQNAPHLVRNRSLIVPIYHWPDAIAYGLGLKVYDRLAGSRSFGASKCLSPEETLRRLPTLNPSHLLGGVMYHDGQFDDARLAVNLAQTATELGAAVANYVGCIGLVKQDGQIVGLRARDAETGDEFDIPATTVINATGVFVDAVRQMDDPDEPAIVSPSQGVHLVLPREFLPGDDALLVPQTDDGRVLFAVPWHGRVVLGTTDTPVARVTLEPRALPEETEFILKHAAQYLTRAPTPSDVLSVYAGLRPLVRSGKMQQTASLSRDHQISVSASGLITITGGKWTTYRKMAEDVVDRAERAGHLKRLSCQTRTLQIHGWTEASMPENSLSPYGADAKEIQALVDRNPDLDKRLHPQLEVRPAEVIWQVRNEMARQVEDVLARRTRSLFLNASASIECATVVAQLMASELNCGQDWIEEQVKQYSAIAQGYCLG